MTAIKTNDKVRVLRPTWTGQRYESVPGVVVYHVIAVEDERAWIETRAPGAVRIPVVFDVRDLALEGER